MTRLYARQTSLAQAQVDNLCMCLWVIHLIDVPLLLPVRRAIVPRAAALEDGDET
jgi:hypothetical protein